MPIRVIRSPSPLVCGLSVNERRSGLGQMHLRLGLEFQRLVAEHSLCLRRPSGVCRLSVK